MGMAMQDQLGAAPGEGLAEGLAVQQLLMAIASGGDGRMVDQHDSAEPFRPRLGQQGVEARELRGTQAPGAIWAGMGAAVDSPMRASGPRRRR
jgi:hypothetical protein